MKRSEINKLMQQALTSFEHCQFKLPLWHNWSQAKWDNNADTAKYCYEHQMGWDITDFGEGDFHSRGLILFCIRNGRQGERTSLPYAEKIMIVREAQETPLHFHKVKMEDIIVRAGGNLVIEMYNSDKGGNLLKDERISIRSDGRLFELDAGEPFIIKPGSSSTIPRLLYHRFYGEKGKGEVVVGEVSQVNDDFKDNYFYDAKERFTKIIEDTPPLYPLWNEILTQRIN